MLTEHGKNIYAPIVTGICIKIKHLNFGYSKEVVRVFGQPLLFFMVQSLKIYFRIYLVI